MFLYGLSLVLTAITFVFAAIPLKLLSERLSPVFYWSIGGAISAGLFFSSGVILAISFLSLLLLVGMYDFFSKKGQSLEAATVYSLLISSLVGLSSFDLVKKQLGPETLAKLRLGLAEMISSSKSIKTENIEEVVDKILVQIPSGVVILLIVSLFLAICFTGYFNKVSTSKAVMIREHLKSFTLPNVTLWLLMAALLGSFLELDKALDWASTLSLNALNVFVVLYFFQGLAVLYTFFDCFKVGKFSRVFWTVLFVLQLFLALSLIGVADFWLDFRKKFKLKAAKISIEKFKN